MQERQTSEANGERVFQPVFVHGLENPCSVRYEHCLAKLEVVDKKLGCHAAWILNHEIHLPVPARQTSETS